MVSGGGITVSHGMCRTVSPAVSSQAEPSPKLKQRRENSLNFWEFKVFTQKHKRMLWIITAFGFVLLE